MGKPSNEQLNNEQLSPVGSLPDIECHALPCELGRDGVPPSVYNILKILSARSFQGTDLYPQIPELSNQTSFCSGYKRTLLAILPEESVDFNANFCQCLIYINGR